VISPWNFPLSIPCGMVSAALVMGSPVLFKPAEQSPACGWELARLLLEASVDADALALLPAAGDLGRWLVAEPRIATIAFTGSVAVGLEIQRRAHEAEDQRQIKRIVAELGGKNCVLVDSDADLDDTVPAIVQSAYVYAGQKCSAAARVLAHEAVADHLMQRLAGAVAVLESGPADAFATDVPPVIERAAQERVLRYQERAAQDGTIAARAEPVPESGWYCPPTLAVDLDPASPVLREEVFGPLLTVERVASLEEAVQRVDALPYALTGGLFSRDPATVARVTAGSPVGNLYVNRAITGAMVGRQPFGGNRLSGTGTKAGGPAYLLQFVEPHVVTENTVRHGLVVE